MASTPRQNGASSREMSLNNVNTPLGFFALALLIIEGFLGTALIGAKLPSNLQMQCVYLGVGLFVLVICIVALMVWYKSKDLTFGSKDHKEVDKAKIKSIADTQTEKVTDKVRASVSSIITDTREVN